MQGYIKDYRQELDSDIWLMPPLYHRVWQFLKYKVNHKDNRVPMRDGSFKTIKKGQHLTSMRKIANQVGYFEQGAWKEPNPKTVKSILNWLEKQEMISISSDGNRKYTLITLTNWDLFQEKDNDSNSIKSPYYPGEGMYSNSNYTEETPTNQSPFGNENGNGNSKYTESTQSLDTNKNEKNDKELFSSSSRDKKYAEIIQFYQSNLQKSITESPYNHELISHFYDEWGYDLLLASMKVAAKQEAKGVAFLEGVLKNWRNAGVNSLEDARDFERQFKEQKAKPSKKNSNVVPMKNREPEYDDYDYGF